MYSMSYPLQSNSLQQLVIEAQKDRIQSLSIFGRKGHQSLVVDRTIMILCNVACGIALFVSETNMQGNQ